MAVKSAIINVMEGASRKAARSLIHDFGEVEHLQVSKKGPADFVSNADLKAERILRNELAKGRPDFAMLLEEGGSADAEQGGTSDRWIVDPLDGTTNFLHGLPHFAISIAHEQNGEIVAGIVHDPIREEFFWAEKGKGAYVNERRLRVSARARLSEALIATGIPFKGRETHPRYMETLAAIVPQIAGIRRYGSAALDLAYVAAGRYDGFWEFGLEPWDIAAGIIMVREAGGLITAVDGRANMMETGSVLATNEPLHTDIGDILRRAMRGD